MTIEQKENPVFIIENDPLNRIFTNEDAVHRAADVLADTIVAEVDILKREESGEDAGEWLWFGSTEPWWPNWWQESKPAGEPPAWARV